MAHEYYIRRIPNPKPRDMKKSMRLKNEERKILSTPEMWKSTPCTPTPKITPFITPHTERDVCRKLSLARTGVHVEVKKVHDKIFVHILERTTRDHFMTVMFESVKKYTDWLGSKGKKENASLGHDTAKSAFTPV